MGMETGVKITGETDMGRQPVHKKVTSYRSWIILASGLWLTSLGGGFVGSWWNETDGSGLVIVADRLIEIVDKLDTKVEQIKTSYQLVNEDLILSKIDSLEHKLDVAPDLISEKIEIPPCECKHECEEKPEFVPGIIEPKDCDCPRLYFDCPDYSSIDIPTATPEPKKPDRALRVICVNRYGPTKCLPSLDRAVVVTRGYIRECLLVNDNLKCEREKRLR